MSWTNTAIIILSIIYVIVCVLMCVVVLMQRSKQEGLGAAFGGGFTESVWGAQTSQVLVKGTVLFASLFFILSISLARLYSHRANMEKEVSPIQQELLQPVAPVKPASAKAGVAPAAATASTPSGPTAVPKLTPAPAAPATPPATNAAPAK